MSNERLCVYCLHSDKHRKQAENIRCTRFSRWVPPRGAACEEYREKNLREPFSELLSNEDIVASAACIHRKGGLCK